jgi:hypothetical protein
MYSTRQIGLAKLEIFEQMKSLIAFTDLCSPAATIEFVAHQRLLRNSFILFALRYPQYELEARVKDGMVFIRRNGLYQHSEQYLGDKPCHVALQWDISSIGCGIVPLSSDSDMNQHMRAVRTPITVPPSELVKTLRTENLLFNSAYASADDLFTTVIDCIHLCEIDIRRHGGEKFIWKKLDSGYHPVDEPDISKFVALFLTSHGASRNFDVVCEPVAGTGNIDFYITAPIHNAGLAKVAIEAKKAESNRLIHGFETQLPEYMRRIGTQFGIYLVYWLKSENYKYPHQQTYSELEVEKLHPIKRLSTMRTIGFDLSFGASPSRQ